MGQADVSLSKMKHVAGRVLQPGVDIVLAVDVPGHRDDEFGFGFDVRILVAGVDG
jgi:hypothetical protein